MGCEIAFSAILADRSVMTWGESRCDQSKVEGRLKDAKQIAPARTGFAALLADGSVVTWPQSHHADNKKDELQNVQKLVANGSVVALGSQEFGRDDGEVRDQLKNVIDATPAGFEAFAALLQDGSVVTVSSHFRKKYIIVPLSIPYSSPCRPLKRNLILITKAPILGLGQPDFACSFLRCQAIDKPYLEVHGQL